jgi:hypothetical protein
MLLSELRIAQMEKKELLLHLAYHYIFGVIINVDLQNENEFKA